MAIVHLETGAEPSERATAAPDETAQVEALRLRAAHTLEAAYRFLEGQDDSWALLRAQVLCEARPASELGERLAATQRGDGSFARLTLVSGGAPGFAPIPEAANGDGLVGTLEALLIAADARILHADWVESAVRFLESRQTDAGAFPGPTPPGASAAVARETETFWTGMVAGVLGRTPLSRPEPLEAAGALLAGRFTPDAIETSHPLLAATAHYFTNVAHDDADEILQWCGRALEKGFRSRQLDAVTTLRVLLTCDAQAMPGATFDGVELLERLFEEQAGDGGFAELALEGPATRTTQTFDAMLGIVRICAAL